MDWTSNKLDKDILFEVNLTIVFEVLLISFSLLVRSLYSSMSLFFKSIFAAAGHPNAVFEIDFKNLKALTSGETKEITEWENLS